MSVKQTLNKYIKTEIYAFKRVDGTRSSIRVPVILIEKAKEFCAKKGISLQYLVKCIEHQRPQGLNQSDSIRYILFEILYNGAEVTFDD